MYFEHKKYEKEDLKNEERNKWAIDAEINNRVKNEPFENKTNNKNDKFNANIIQSPKDTNNDSGVDNMNFQLDEVTYNKEQQPSIK